MDSTATKQADLEHTARLLAAFGGTVDGWEWDGEIHLDRPDADTRARRLAGHVARQAEMGHADCPMCREMAAFGGDEVFDERGTAIEPGSGRAAESWAAHHAVAPPVASAPLPSVVRARPTAPAPARLPHDLWPESVRAIRAAGARAVGAVERAAAGRPWTRASVETAARWLADGDRRAGVSRRWPQLAGRLRNAAALTPQSWIAPAR